MKQKSKLKEDALLLETHKETATAKFSTIFAKFNIIADKFFEPMLEIYIVKARKLNYAKLVEGVAYFGFFHCPDKKCNFQWSNHKMYKGDSQQCRCGLKLHPVFQVIFNEYLFQKTRSS